MTYTADHPPLPETPDQLRARIPGWGADLDHADRPAFPQERLDPGASGAHWEFPDRQPEPWPRERSIEHEMLTPVFGTAQPPRALSGAIRQYAYRRFGEARSAHWLLLIAADRVDVAESRVTALLSGHPDLLLTETGVLGELTRHPLRSRVGRGRADVKHQWIDPLVVGAPYLVAGGVAYALLRRGRRG
jgi:hypothetical protein